MLPGVVDWITGHVRHLAASGNVPLFLRILSKKLRAMDKWMDEGGDEVARFFPLFYDAFILLQYNCGLFKMSLVPNSSCMMFPKLPIALDIVYLFSSFLSLIVDQCFYCCCRVFPFSLHYLPFTLPLHPVEELCHHYRRNILKIAYFEIYCFFSILNRKLGSNLASVLVFLWGHFFL